MYKIYCITNLINGKKYIGQTKQDVYKRFVGHCTQGCLLTRSIKKHGRKNFRIEILGCSASNDTINKYEILTIKKTNSLFPNGYNLSKGGDGVSHTEYTKQKISEKLKGKPKSPEHVEKIRANAKINGEKRKGVPRPEFSKEWKDNISKGHKGKKLSEEHKKAISDALQNSEKAKNADKGKFFRENNPSKNPESRAKIAKAKWKPIKCIEDDIEFTSIKQASEYYNIKPAMISQAIIRGTKTKNKTFIKLL